MTENKFKIGDEVFPVEPQPVIEPCLYCQSKCIVEDRYKYFYVACSDTEACGYTSCDKPTAQEAIIAHNRISKAVRGEK